MKKVKRILFILTALFSMVFLAGCEKSAQLKTTLTLDKDCKGERIMHLELSKDSFAENVTVSMEDIQAVFAEKCPEELTCEFAETNDSYTADIHLAFDSEEDYYNKIKAIVEQEEPGDIIIASSVFNNGISIRERFKSEDLLRWFVDALIEKQYVSAENENYIFYDNGCDVEYEGTRYYAGYEISLNQVTSSGLYKIGIKTRLNLDGTWNREISFYVPKDSMRANGDAIKEFLEDGVAKGAEGSWEDYKESGEKGQVYTIKAESIPVETMERLMQEAFHTEESVITDQTEAKYAETGSENLVRSSAYIVESYDLSEFVLEGYDSNPQIEYRVEKNGVGVLDSGAVYDGTEYSISHEYSIWLRPAGINLKSKITGENKYNRTFEFTFEGLEKAEKEILKNRAENLVKNLGKVKAKDSKNTYTLTFTVNGDREKAGKLYQKLLGQEMSANYAAEHKWIGFSNTFAYEEYIDLSGFLPDETGQAVDVNYELSFGMGAKLSGKLENAFEAKGSTLYFSGSTNSPISVSLSGTRTNVRTILILLGLGIVILAFFVILLLMRRWKKKIGAPQPQTDELPGFCTNCGEKFENDEIMFCVKCGRKRGE